MNERVLPLTGVHNFRDYGGYALPGGGRLKQGVFFRSAQHRDATDEDLEAIDRLALLHIVDLRGDAERAEHPCRRPQGFAGRVLFADGDTSGTAPHLAALQGNITEEGAIGALTATYRGMPFRPKLIEALRHYFDALETGEPSLIHCLAGKDRTGLAVALFHHIAGVHPDDLMADYLLTNSAGNIEARIAAGASAIRAHYGATMTDAAIRAMMGVSPQFLEAAMDAIRQEHGSLDAYADAVLGVTPERAARIRERAEE